ncbi:hypothetical protein GQF56_15590 [Rhodobacter sphaeroides]|jgi:hypothetical protein|uniref:Uncharacterized protein n=1 Tax=Cereibacter sphaeroides (strain ATCC 17023 / DSM 158 / JCM 6121 / CCUG 31486 / LMG 2827 / NBRC 12203 / NCIMB 8253 / ATH 2.4.1.) TaxID=272943 RepID=Q3IVS7_CERS4|nr:hypothetical protein [Cereibacter sphaeroides]ABA81357.1 hypothetical protein RSP_3751 [Cereibacter sphaeroides 2.4.1]AXC63648.1 hypothetical protein DQL45_19935 [Cereibacter sphaeroides 2.4.1]MVX49274.1 hypothetical protein [Cereibacter sphaeroides]QHA12008.1 hypothetical protein GQR99_19915 [Cereibacter sphaeroides]QHA15196.1 hypothetical protein GQY06_19875 [Cereibacter sphaeroides]
MDSKEDVERLEKLVGQLQGLYSEVGALAKKNPNDAVNSFKLKLINRVLEMGNEVLGEKYKPFDDFDSFDPDDAPSTSDVTIVVAQYMEEAERFRSDNVISASVKGSYGWYYVVDGRASEVRSGPPTKIGRK